MFLHQEYYIRREKKIGIRTAIAMKLVAGDVFTYMYMHMGSPSCHLLAV